LATTNQITTFERSDIVGHRTYGVIAGESKSLVLLHEVDEFQFDGYMVIRRQDITNSYSDASDEYSTRIMKQEGLWERIPRRIKQLPLHSWKSLLDQFVGQVVILENEPDSEFLIGPVQKTNRTGVVIRYFDGCGNWTGNCPILYANITCMKFENRYINLHAKYLRP
jgi:hypothetical protein